MSRLFVISLILYLLAACTAIPISSPLKPTHTSNTTIQWQTSELVTRCQATTITNFQFALNINGEWQSIATLENTDLQQYRPYWEDHIMLKFSSVAEPVATLDVFTEKTPAASVRTVEKTGVWKVGGDRFSDLQSATIIVEHECEGLLEE